MKTKMFSLVLCLLLTATIVPILTTAQALKENPVLDAKVKKFLSDNSGQWQDMNVPTSDAQLLYDLV
ncbi:MAG: methyltransferase, partial [Bacteroidota bacterium]|nr:methyltransferase [Bacteroidota bacterium]